MWARASAARVDGHPDRAGDGEGRQGVAHLMGAVDSEADGLRPPRGTGHEAGTKLGVDLDALCHQVGAAHSGAADRIGQHPGRRAAGHGPNPGVVAIEDGGSRGRQGFDQLGLGRGNGLQVPEGFRVSSDHRGDDSHLRAGHAAQFADMTRPPGAHLDHRGGRVRRGVGEGERYAELVVE